jgi:hypothetical protein
MYVYAGMPIAAVRKFMDLLGPSLAVFRRFGAARRGPRPAARRYRPAWLPQLIGLLLLQQFWSSRSFAFCFGSDPTATIVVAL